MWALANKRRERSPSLQSQRVTRSPAAVVTVFQPVSSQTGQVLAAVFIFLLHQINQSCTVPQNRRYPAGLDARVGARTGWQRAFPVHKLCTPKENSVLLREATATSHSPLGFLLLRGKCLRRRPRGIYEFRRQPQATRKRACPQRVDEHPTSAGRIQRPAQPKCSSQQANATTAGVRALPVRARRLRSHGGAIGDVPRL